MPRIICTCSAALLLAAAGIAASQSTAPAPAQRFATLRALLASANFAERQSGQKQLDQISPADMEALAAWDAQENDPEVKARLDDRIDEMAAWRLTHPPPLTVNFKNTSFDGVITELNRQLGGPMITSGRGGAGAATFSLAAKDMPLMAILWELNRQTPMAISSSISVTGATSTATLSLTPGAINRQYKIVDTFAVAVQAGGQPSLGTWRIAVLGLADPRVHVVEYSQLRLDKLIDQDGHSLMPLVVADAGGMGSSIRPLAGWTSSAQLNPAPGLQRIKELHGSILLRVLEKEQNLSLDLKKEIAPIQTSRGTLSIERVPGRDPFLHLDPPPSPDNRVVPGLATATPQQYLTIRTFDENGKLLGMSLTAGVRITLELRGVGANGRVELSWAEKTRNVTLPIEWTDLPLPLPPPPAAVIRLP